MRRPGVGCLPYGSDAGGFSAKGLARNLTRTTRARDLGSPIWHQMESKLNRCVAPTPATAATATVTSASAAIGIASSRSDRRPFAHRRAASRASTPSMLAPSCTAALAADVHRGGVMELAVNHRRCRDLVAEDGSALRVGPVRGDDDAALGVALGDQLERKLVATWSQGRCRVEGGTPCGFSAAGLPTPPAEPDMHVAAHPALHVITSETR
jgi:hypothetical protein